MKIHQNIIFIAHQYTAQYVISNNFMHHVCAQISIIEWLDVFNHWMFMDDNNHDIGHDHDARTFKSEYIFPCVRWPSPKIFQILVDHHDLNWLIINLHPTCTYVASDIHQLSYSVSVYDINQHTKVVFLTEAKLCISRTGTTT